MSRKFERKTSEHFLPTNATVWSAINRVRLKTEYIESTIYLAQETAKESPPSFEYLRCEGALRRIEFSHTAQTDQTITSAWTRLYYKADNFSPFVCYCSEPRMTESKEGPAMQMNMNLSSIRRIGTSSFNTKVFPAFFRSSIPYGRRDYLARSHCRWTLRATTTTRKRTNPCFLSGRSSPCHFTRIGACEQTLDFASDVRPR